MSARRSWTPWLVLALSLLLTAVVTLYASATAKMQDRLRFQNLVQRNQGVLQSRMEIYIALLRGANGLFTASEDVSREEFRSFVSGLELDRRYPGIQGLGFALRVDATWKEAVTAEARRESDPRFTIWPESSFDDLYPIFYLEPLNVRNRAALGFDMHTEPARRAAMERARDTGQPVATGRVQLVQESEGRRQSGFLIYFPVYRQGSPLATVEDRREALEGFVYAPFRADDLLRGVLGSGNPNLAVEVYAGAPALRNLLHRSHPPWVVGPDPRLVATESFEVAGSPWTIVYSSLPVFEAGSARDQVWILLLLGLLTSVTLFAVNRAQIAARAQAETASQTKDHFMATLSHELRTPLTPVLAVLSRLEKRRDPLPSDVRDGMAMIRRNVELEARLIDDLLDLTRISQGKLELRRGPTDVRQVLAHALEASERPGSPGPAIIADTTEIENAELWTWADAPRLTQVFWNLISNARKFTPPEGEVRVRAWREEGEVVVEVSDTGIGIDPELLPRIFDAFQQGQRNITRRFGGLGLGLAITEKIVALHGGRIAAASKGRGEGATFTVRMPAGKPAVPPSFPWEAAPEPKPEPARERPLHILLVEDHPDTAEAMADLLRATGRRVTVAGSVAEGRAAAEASGSNGGRIDLVLSDIGLPDGSGHDLMAELSRRFGLKGIALTGYGMEEDVERSKQVGFARHLTKPVSLEQLDSAIRQVASG